MKTTSRSLLMGLAVAMTSSFVAAAPEFATQAAHQLEQLYLSDCQTDPTPRGYYGAFLQPCTFEFRESDPIAAGEGRGDACSDDSSRLVSKPVPMHWFFNLTEHYKEDDWDSMSSDDLPSAEQLMLWPDQCVGATPRCYSLEFANADIKETLAKLFPDGIPEEATHVRVDCRGDAVALSRLVYSFAGGFEKSSATIFAWMVTVVLFSVVAILWCLYGCARLCCFPDRNGPHKGYKPLVAHGEIVHPNYVDCAVAEEGYSDKKPVY